MKYMGTCIDCGEPCYKEQKLWKDVIFLGSVEDGSGWMGIEYEMLWWHINCFLSLPWGHKGDIVSQMGIVDSS